MSFDTVSLESFVREGVPRDYMGFPIVRPSTTEQTGKIDAVYMPTNFCKELELNTLNRLRSISQVVYTISFESEREQTCILPNIDPKTHPEIEAKFRDLHTTKLGQHGYGASYYIALKRNISLAHARRNGYSSIMLIDDDIRLDKNLLRSACSLLRDDLTDMVGFYALNHPDVSTLDFISSNLRRENPKVSVGASALMLKPERVTGFFPACYNEDWMFIYIANWSAITLSAGSSMQIVNDQIFSGQRTAEQPFGDILARGIRQASKSKDLSLLTKLEFWKATLTDQVADIEGIMKIAPPGILLDMLRQIRRSTGAIMSTDLCRYMTSYAQETDKEILWR